MDTFAFIGAGNMGGAIIEAVCRSTEPHNVIIFDKCTEKMHELAEKTGCITAQTASEAAQKAGFVFLCVKPNILPDALRGLLPVFKEALNQ